MPVVPRPAPTLSAAPARALEEHERWEEVLVAGPVAGEARGAEIVRSRLEEADLAGARLHGLRLADCEAVRSNLANLLAVRGSMTRCAFAGCRMTGFAWTDGTVQDVRFTECLIDLAAFGATRFRQVAFEGCVLREADFAACRFDSVSFENCDLTGASFSGASFARSTLRGCALEDLRGIDGLRGATLDWGDVVGLAGAFATALGIRVRDDQ